MARARTKGSRKYRIDGDASKLVGKLSKAKQRKLDQKEPGAILIFDGDNRAARDRQMLRRGEIGPSRKGNAKFTTQMAYKAPLAFDGDVRKLVAFVQLAAAMHFHDSIAKQVEADGAKKLPSERGGKDRLFGIESGDFYTSFRIQPVKGSSVKASGQVLTPGGDAKKIEFARGAYLRNIDLISARGAANKVIQHAFRTYMDAAYGPKVRTPPRVMFSSILRDAIRNMGF